VTTKDDRTNIFGIPVRAARARRGGRPVSAPLDAQAPHRGVAWPEFERLEGELTTADFFDFDTERFLPAQAHADGALIQLAAGFDAFACAVAHHHHLPKPDVRPSGRPTGSPSSQGWQTPK